MSNVSKLAEVGLVHPGHLSDEHRDVIDNQMSDEEIAALLSAHAKLGGVVSMHSDQPHANVF